LSTTITLRQPTVVAVARDSYLRPSIPFQDPVNLPNVAPPAFGQDITSSINRKPPGNYDQGSTVAVLEPKMRQLTRIFAGGDRTGMVKRLFDTFLTKHSRVSFFDDRDLNHAALHHENIKHFCRAALAAPNMLDVAGGHIRIHQALRNAKWDINNIFAPTDLGVPAFNSGVDWAQTGDFNNGLALLINGIQYAYCVATKYLYDSATAKYSISIRYIFYDVFGLDDDDLREYGVKSDAYIQTDAAKGITAWWQLQHQHGFCPLVTRIIIDRSFEAPAQ
jgi:hypothetical protein